MSIELTGFFIAIFSTPAGVLEQPSVSHFVSAPWAAVVTIVLFVLL